jgi:hypothetical protein
VGHGGRKALGDRGLGKYAAARIGFVRAVEALAFEHATTGRPRDARTLFDALLPERGLALSTYCNALWLVQDDNTHLGVDETRARAYLACSIGRRPDNPAIFFNASCVLAELGDIEGALEQIQDALA